MAPSASTRLAGGDELEVLGNPDRVRELLRLQGVDVEQTTGRQLGVPGQGVDCLRLQIGETSELCGESLRSFGFRERLGVAVLAVQTTAGLKTRDFGDDQLSPGDVLFGIGDAEKVSALVDQLDESTLLERGVSALRELQDEPLLLLRLPPGSPLVGSTVGDSRVGELIGLTIVGIQRGEALDWAVSPNTTFEAEDRLYVSGEEQKLRSLLKIGDVELETQVAAPALESEEVGVVEATLGPRSSLAGSSLSEVSFRDRFGVQVLALWREGRAVREGLADRVLRVGDGLLLQGRRGQLAKVSQDPDLVVLSDLAETPRRTRRAPFAVGALILMIGLVALEIQPIHVAAFAAGCLVLLSGALRMEEAYRAIEWRAIFLVAAVLPVGGAMEQSGAALFLATSVMDLAGPMGPYAVLASLVVLSSLLSQGLDGAPAVVLLTPVVLQAAEGLGLSPYPLMMGVALAASAAFMTPFSHKANLLVMGLGGYRSVDYLKVGTPLTVVLLAVITAMIPWFFPF